MPAQHSIQPRLLLLADLLAPASLFAEQPAKKPKDDTVQLDTVEVTAEQTSAYVPSTAHVGPLGNKDLFDTPMSINVFTNDLIRNTQAVAPDDIFKLSPVVQFTSPQSRFFPSANLRGFNSASTKRIDGIPNSESYTNIDIEDKESIEIITGLSGFLTASATSAAPSTTC